MVIAVVQKWYWYANFLDVHRIYHMNKSRQMARHGPSIKCNMLVLFMATLDAATCVFLQTVHRRRSTLYCLTSLIQRLNSIIGANWHMGEMQGGLLRNSQTHI